jgi:hypothetical protein
LLFDVDHRIQIADFSPIHLEVNESEKVTAVFTSEECSPDADIRGFCLDFV